VSYRVLIKPAYFDNGSDDSADVVIPEDATDEQIKQFANVIAWCSPMRIFTPSVTHLNYLKFIAVLEDEHSMDRDTDWSVWIKAGDAPQIAWMKKLR